MNSYAYASRVEFSLADRDYELIPTQEEGQVEVELNAVAVNQDPKQVSEDQHPNSVCEGKPRSMSHVSNLCNYVMFSLVHYRFQELIGNLSCIILGSFGMQY